VFSFFALLLYKNHMFYLEKHFKIYEHSLREPLEQFF
jgi:hypothetical protein